MSGQYQRKSSESDSSLSGGPQPHHTMSRHTTVTTRELRDHSRPALPDRRTYGHRFVELEISFHSIIPHISFLFFFSL